MHRELRTHDDDASGGVVHAFAEEVLTEAALLALEAVGQGLERTVGLALDGVGLAGIVEQRVDGFLQHTLLVAENHFRSLDLDEAFQAVVADDHAAVEVVHVAGGETAAVERDERAEIRRDDRNHLHHHPFGVVDLLRFAEGLDDAQTLESLCLALLRSLGFALVAQVVGEGIEVNVLEHLVDGFGAHAGHELARIVVRKFLIPLWQLVEDIEIFFFGKQVQIVDAVLLDFLGSAGAHHHVFLVVDDGFQLLGRNAEQVTDLVGRRTEIPDVRHRNGQADVAHALAAHLLLGHLHAAAVAHDAAVADALVFAAVALIVLCRTEDAFAEESVTFRLVGAVVDSLRLEHLTRGLLQNFFRRSQANGDLVEVVLYLYLFL